MKFDPQTIMAHKLQAMRLNRPSLTLNEATAIILKNAPLGGMSEIESENFKAYLVGRVVDLWDAPTEQAASN